MQLPIGQNTIAHAFREAGYQTAYFGKWHVDGFQERNGRAAMHIVPMERRGEFDEWMGYENNNSQWDCWVHGRRNGGEVHYRLPGYETDALTDLFIEYLAKKGKEAGGTNGSSGVKAKSFFAVLSVQPPHDPYLAPAEWMARHNPARLVMRPNVPDIPSINDVARRELAGTYAMIENLDWNLGRIRKAMEEAGLTNNTHIVFFSDHGDMHGSHGQLRKTTPWEESIRIPFIIGGMRNRYAFKCHRQAVPINHVDIAPTTLGLCGISKPTWMAGTDYSGHRIHGRAVEKEPDSAYLQLCVPTRHAHSLDRPWRGIVTRDGWKYVCLEGQPMMMHNLNDDPYELANLAFNTAFQAERRRLQDRLAQWIADTGDSFQLPEI